MIPPKPGRTPAPPIGEEPKVAREQAALEAHRKRLHRAASGLAKAAMDVAVCVPGTIGYRAAEQRAKVARAALEAAIDLFVKRNRLDAHMRSYRSAEESAADVLKHAKLSDADHRVAAPIVEQLMRSNRGMRELMERQIADIDEAIQ